MPCAVKLQRDLQVVRLVPEYAQDGNELKLNGMLTKGQAREVRDIVQDGMYSWLPGEIFRRVQ